MRVYIEKGMKAGIESNVAFTIEELVDIIDSIGTDQDKQEVLEILKNNDIKFEEVIWTLKKANY